MSKCYTAGSDRIGSVFYVTFLQKCKHAMHVTSCSIVLYLLVSNRFGLLLPLLLQDPCSRSPAGDRISASSCKVGVGVGRRVSGAAAVAPAKSVETQPPVDSTSSRLQLGCPNTTTIYY